MYIKPIGVGSYTDPTTAGYAVEPKSENQATSIETLLEKIQSPTAESEVLREIANDYDVKSIQPQEFSDMLGRLLDAGAISDEEHQMLSQLRVELDKAGYEVDEPVDLLEFCADKLREIDENQGEKAEIPENAKKNAKAQLAWLQKMAIIQEDPESIGLNALV